MLFNSLEYLIFLPLVFILYFVLPKKTRPFILLMASYIFYTWWNYKLIGLILFTTLISYFSGKLIGRIDNKSKRKIVLVLSIILCLGVLVFFKYFDFLSNSIITIINSFMTKKVDYITLNIILPVGISFYTFQTTSYVIDVYKKRIEPENNYIYYSLYVSFFPQLVAGPIERPEHLLPQLKNQDGIKIDNINLGIKYILTGYVKKIAVADILGIFVTRIFQDISNMNGLSILIGCVLFSLEILGDFSGYSDIAIGSAKLFNIDLMKNFDKPYHSASIHEFWNRWHISLSSWFKDYIYIPLGGSRVSRFRWIINILIVFFVSGLWHGANWTFVIWGLLNGIFLIIGRFTLPIRNKFWNKLKVNINGKPLKIARIIFTFIIISIVWISFRANSFNDMLIAYRNLFTKWNFSKEYFYSIYSIFDNSTYKIIYILITFILMEFIDYLPRIFNDNKMSVYILRKVIYVCLIWLVVACFIYLQKQDISSSFIYFQF